MVLEYEQLGLVIEFDDDSRTTDENRIPSTIRCGEDGVIRLPWSSHREIVHKDRLILVLTPWETPASPADITLMDPSRNVIAITGSCNVDWIIDRGPDHPSENEYFTHAYSISDNLIVRCGRFYKLDSETGEILTSWSPSAFEVGERLVQFDHPIRAIEQVNETLAMQTATSWHEPVGTDRTHTISGYTLDGDKLWERTLQKYNWRLESRDDEYLLWAEPAMGVEYRFRLDPLIGELEMTCGDTDERSEIVVDD